MQILNIISVPVLGFVLRSYLIEVRFLLFDLGWIFQCLGFWILPPKMRGSKSASNNLLSSTYKHLTYDPLLHSRAHL